MAEEAEEGGTRGEGAALMSVTKGRTWREEVGSAGTRSRESGRLVVVAVAGLKVRKQKGQGMAAVAVVLKGGKQ